MDKLTAMATFGAVVEAGSFTRAAERLSIPKARVSQRISDLERHLGARLLQRTTRSLNLTEDGRAYYSKCASILQQVDELEATLRGGLVEPRGSLRIEALASVARWVLAPRLHEFQRRYPQLTLTLCASDRVSHLLEEGIDCAIRGGTLPDSSLVARHACDVRLGLYAAPGYLEDAGNARHPRELREHRRLSWFTGQRNPFAWKLESTDGSFDLGASQGLRFDDPDVAIASCLAGSGICPAAPFAVESWVRAGALVPVLPQWSFAPRPIHLVYPGDRHLSARVRCFVDWALELMRQSPSLSMSPQELAGNTAGRE
ncbi:LysR family transcriptional regulator [Pseudomonas paraeruginosa]|uniref:LysR substrate binding domain protein n=1 Tax=Pseudomonas paraeruginosa TaxID=2994495 RepID=A0A2R3J3J6_9PSED|nr:MULTISPECIES: LysR family transcriptional regulator [Pseudomonas aeruginosa group]AVK08749.1 lysR substrate binding domain protein [Pseudomonas paraeruginosa]AWE92564.1 lysR substrate binding domain protein [Pseudomonas paraeruginosa]KSD62084.1 LysR family transcriptional regulator [Pseudomonas aeruginosa]KSR49337.1 LysR family transcriptional regulator [Pseudomonas aeruginosa]MCT9633535.1 LysR family transcriptional regulator [Pseudomonas aeruginosa]